MIENAQAHEMIHVPGLRKLLLEAQAAQYDEFPRQAALKFDILSNGVLFVRTVGVTPAK